MNWNEKHILITGGASGIGKATVEACLSKGARVSVIDKNEEGLELLERELDEKFKGQLQSFKCDVSDEKAFIQVIRKASAYGIHGFVNNAGVEGPHKMLHESDSDTFKQVLDVNLNAAFVGMREVLGVMKPQKYGRIVNTTSVGGSRAIVGLSGYVASKHALEGLTKVAALEYAAHGICVNAIAPGLIDTPMTQASVAKVYPNKPVEGKKAFARHNPTGRLGNSNEVAALICFLLSDESSYVNGQIINADGGQANAYIV